MSATRVDYSQLDDAFALALQRAAFSVQDDQSDWLASTLLREVVETLLWEVVGDAVVVAAAPLSQTRHAPAASLATIEYVEVTGGGVTEDVNDETFSDVGGDDDVLENGDDDDDEAPPREPKEQEDQEEAPAAETPPPETKKKRRRRPPVAEVVEPSSATPPPTRIFRQDEFVGDDGVVRRVASRPLVEIDGEFDEEGDDDDAEIVVSFSGPRAAATTRRLEGGAASLDDDGVGRQLDPTEDVALAARRGLVESLKARGFAVAARKQPRRQRRNSFAEVYSFEEDDHLDVAARVRDLETFSRGGDADDDLDDDDSVVLDLEDDDDDDDDGGDGKKKIRYEPPINEFDPRSSSSSKQEAPVARVVAFGGGENVDAVDVVQALQRARPEDAVVVARVLTRPVLSSVLAATLERWVDEASSTTGTPQRRRKVIPVATSPLVAAATAVVATKLLRFNCGVRGRIADDDDDLFFHEDDFDRAFPSLLADDDQRESSSTAGSLLFDPHPERDDDDDDVASLLDDSAPSTRKRLLYLGDEYLSRGEENDDDDDDDGEYLSRDETPSWSEARAVDFVERHGPRLRFDAAAALFLRKKFRRAVASVLSVAAKDRAVAAAVAALDALGRGSGTSSTTSLQSKRALAVGRVLKPRDRDDVLDDAAGRQRAPLCVALLRLDALCRLGHKDALQPFTHLLRDVLENPHCGNKKDKGQHKSRHPGTRLADPPTTPPHSPRAARAAASASAPPALARPNKSSTPPPWDTAMDAWLFPAASSDDDDDDDDDSGTNGNNTVSHQLRFII